MAAAFGWAAVDGPHAMDWVTYAAARQYLSEERVGARIREIEQDERAEAEAAKRALREQR